MYDIYLFSGIRVAPEIEDLEASLSASEQTIDLERFQECARQDAPHFLLLDLDAQDSIKVFRWLRRGKAQGYILPAAYRHPRISQEEAKLLAEAALGNSQGAYDPAQSETSLQFSREEPVCWTFRASNNRKIRLHIDKLDGHLWQSSDLRKVWSIYYFLGDVAKELRDPYIVAVSQNSSQAYDLYLTHGADKLPALDDLLSTAPVLRESELQQKMVQQNVSLLPVALPKEQALELLYRLEKEGAWGCLLSVAYRHPQIAREQAALLAKSEITKRLGQRPGDTLGPMGFFREDPCCWTFSASSAQLISEERSPGLIFASVDKLDGHIWTREELERFSEEN